MTEQAPSAPLAACPFCGDQPRVTERAGMAGSERPFRCFVACMCGGYSAHAHQDGGGNTPQIAKAEAIAAWNRRHTQEGGESVGGRNEDNSSAVVTAPLASTAEALEAARRIAGLAPSIDAKGAHSYSADAELVARALLASRAVPLAILEEAAQWLIARSYATGPGDTVSDLMAELVEQVRENTLKAAQKVGAGEPRPEGTPNPVVPLQSPSDDKTAINARVQAEYDRLMAIGKHGFYETLFHIVHNERAAAVRVAAIPASEGLSPIPPSPKGEHPSPTRAEMVEALRDVAAERERQMIVEGWTPEHDDEHSDGSMAAAAACYAISNPLERIHREPGRLGKSYWTRTWPWDLKWWKPKNRRYDLVRAGALILAEIERLDRAILTKADSESANMK